MDTRDFSRAGEITRYRSAQAPARAAAPLSREGQSSAAPISLAVIARGLRRWWWQAIATWIIGTAALSVFIYQRFAPTYEAFSLLRVEPTPQELFVSSSSANNGYQNFLETQVQLITSANVLLNAVANSHAPGLEGIRNAPDPEILLRKTIKVDILPKTLLIEVSTSSSSPTEAAAVVNAVVDSYLKSDAEWSEGMTRTQIKNLEAYQTGLESQVKEKQEAWLELAAKGNVTPEAIAARNRSTATEPPRTTVTLETYQDLQQKLLQTELDLTEAETVHEMQRGPEGQPSAAALDRRVAEEFQRDPAVLGVINEIHQVDGQLAKLNRMVVRNSSDATVIEVKRRYAKLLADYDALWEAKKDPIRERLIQPSDAAGTSREAVSRVAALRKTKALLEAKLKGAVVEHRNQDTDTVKASIIQADLKRLEDMQATVSRRLEQFRFESRSQARIRRISEARPPTRAASDKRSKLMMFTPAIMLGLVIGLTTLVEVRGGRLGGPDDLKYRVNADVFSVPELPQNQRPRWYIRSRPHEEVLEDFVHRIDHVREAICGEFGTAGPGRCIVISSAVGGEGKTTLASHLALRCANAGALTLLIDADLRRGSLGRLLGVPESPGLVDILKNNARPEDCLVNLGQIGCHILPAGQPEANPARLIFGRHLAPLLTRLRNSYEMIIIDTPPVLPVADAITLARCCDGVVLATRHDVSRLKLVDQACHLFRSNGIPLLGAVVQGVSTSALPGNSYSYVSSYRSTRPIDPEPDSEVGISNQG
jgi:polysaccharide biosynthesis transport protein